MIIRKSIQYKIILLVALFFISTSMINNGKPLIFNKESHKNMELLYDNIWGTIYYPIKNQCDNTPTITGDGSKINPYNASKYRWIAISQEMLNSPYRVKLMNNPKNNLYKGKIHYGDTIWIESQYKEINGWWIVHDTKNKKHKNSVDFLQSVGDNTLFNNDDLWCGKFTNIKIYKKNDN